jgi:hypothetical protein
MPRSAQPQSLPSCPALATSAAPWTPPQRCQADRRSWQEFGANNTGRLDMQSIWEDAPAIPTGVRMRYKVGAEQLQQVPSLAHRPDGVFRVARTAPVGPTHAVCAVTGATVCGIKSEALEVLNDDWEAACFVEKCADCFAAVLAKGSD